MRRIDANIRAPDAATGATMKTTSREESARSLADDISNGGTIPREIDTDTRLIMPSKLASANNNNCVVCGAGLSGRQKTFCFGHWDYLTVPTAAADDAETFVAYLAETFDRLRIEHIQRHWLAVINGHSRCEVCDCLTSNVERVVVGENRVINQHTVCPDHASFRCTE